MSGRPRKYTEPLTHKSVLVRLSKSQWAAIISAAGETPVSSWIRDHALAAAQWQEPKPCAE